MQEELFKMTAVYRGEYPVDRLASDEPSGKPDLAFVNNVKQFGVLFPLAIRENGRVIAGRRRLSAARIAGRKTVPVLIFSGEMDDDAVISLVENVQRRNNPANELHHIEKLLNGRPPYTFDRLKQKTGMGTAKLNRYLRIRDGLIVNLRRAFNDGVITVKVAEALAKRPRAFQERMLTVLQEEGELSMATIQAAGRVEKKAAAASLPGDLFGTVDSTDSVKVLLTEALTLAAGNKALARRIKNVIDSM